MVRPTEKDSRVRLLFLLNSFATGGTENLIGRLAPRLDPRRYDVSVCAFRIRDEEVFHHYLAEGLRPFSLGINSPLHLPLGILRFYRYLRKNRFTVLYCFLSFPILLGTAVGTLARVPVIIASERTMKMERRWRLVLKRWVSPLIREITVNSRASLDYAVGTIGYPASKVSLIHNGIEVDAFEKDADVTSLRHRYGIDRKDVVIGCVARLEPVKGHSTLLESFKSFRDETHIKLLLVGGGSCEDSLKEKCRLLGLEHQVIFAGIQKEVLPFLRLMDLFVLPSVTEGMPNALIEAMIAGLPAIATAVGGIPEIIEDGSTGLLVPAGDPVRLSAAIRRLIDDRDYAEELSRRGKRALKERFSLETMVDNTEKLLRRQVKAL